MEPGRRPRLLLPRLRRRGSPRDPPVPPGQQTPTHRKREITTKKKHITTCAQTPRAKNYFCTMKTKYYHQSYRVYKLDFGFAGTTVIGKNPRPGAAEKSPPQLNRTRAASRGETITEKICRVI